MSRKSFGDRMLGTLLKSVDAGACVPTVGQHCGTYTKITCNDQHIKTTRYYYLARACGGQCTTKSGVATGKVTVSHC